MPPGRRSASRGTGDLAIDEEAEDLLVEIQQSIKKRRRGRPVRLELSRHCDPELRDFLIEMLDVREKDIYEVSGPLDLTFCLKLSGLDDSLCLPKLTPVQAADFAGWDDPFAAIRAGDRFVHHPYESFDCVVDFVRRAAEDPDVLAIKQTLYRVSGHSPIIAALIRAAENGKQVTVLVELKARFDEENNIHWALKLEEAGCHVIYGLAGLKTHCKILLVVRREEDGCAVISIWALGIITTPPPASIRIWACLPAGRALARTLPRCSTCSPGIPGRPGTTGWWPPRMGCGISFAA